MRYNTWTERNEFCAREAATSHNNAASVAKLEGEQAAWIRSRAPETILHDKKSEEHHKLPEEQTKAERSDATQSILEVDDKPAVQLDTPELARQEREA